MSNLEIKLEKKLTRVCSLLTAGTVGAGWFAVASFCRGLTSSTVFIVYHCFLLVSPNIACEVLEQTLLSN
jgi:hypothetical protein